MNEAFELRTLTLEDETAFLAMTNKSNTFHHPWVQAPLTSVAFQAFYERSLKENQSSFLVLLQNNIVGVFNISEIVRGNFQSAYLGFYSAIDYAGQGWMSKGLKLLQAYAFNDLKLHRLEANIQPQNVASINLVKRNGFREEGFSPRYLQINGKWCDHLRFAITQEEWQS
ncbi:MAG: GNAT family N-acetyltransferase [Candidatus Berkiella sp.]